MNDEQKRKEDLEAAKGWLAIAKKNNNTMAIQILEKLFPELRENEDERIRKEIISFITDARNWFPKEETKSSWIAWLEKQAEQEQDDKVEVLMSLEEAIEHCKEKSCGSSTCALEHEQLEKWLTELKELKEQKPAWSEEDEKNWRHCLHYIDAYVTPVKEHVDWFKNIRNRMQSQSQSKQEWSEEDEKMRNSIIEEIRPFGECPDYPTDEDREYYYSRTKMIDWLKSINPNRWKPSDLQLEALESAYKQLPNIQYFLQSLYNDLKKL